MQPPLFYAPPENLDGDTISLPADEARHAARVMRLRVGTLVMVIDGLGTAFRAEITRVTARKVTVRVHTKLRDYGEPAVGLTLAAGLSAGSKFDDVVQRGTELGVRRFVPLVTERSKVTVAEPRRARSRVTRLERVALAAVKQCRRSYLPRIAFPTSFGDFLQEYDADTVGLLFHPGKGAGQLDQVPLDRLTKRVTLLVGPESGFSDMEIERAVDAGFRPVGLGHRILRTETAGPIVAALVMERLGELR